MTDTNTEPLIAHVYLDTCSGQRFVQSEKITRPNLHEYLGTVDLSTAELTAPELEVSRAEVDAYAAAWEAERRAIGPGGIAPAGTKTRAGLRAAFAERERRVNGTDRD